MLLTFLNMFDRLSYSKKFCETYKTICIHKSIFNIESNDKERINNYLIFLIRRTVKHYLKKKSTALNILGGSTNYYSIRFIFLVKFFISIIKFIEKLTTSMTSTLDFNIF